MTCHLISCCVCIKVASLLAMTITYSFVHTWFENSSKAFFHIQFNSATLPNISIRSWFCSPLLHCNNVAAAIYIMRYHHMYNYNTRKDNFMHILINSFMSYVSDSGKTIIKFWKVIKIIHYFGVPRAWSV